MLSHKRDTTSAKRFLKKALCHCYEVPVVINTDQNAAYPCAVSEVKQEGLLSQRLELRRIKYLNNVIESDHRRIKRRIRPMMEFYSFKTANRMLKGIEAMAMMIKQQTYFLKQTRQDQIALLLKGKIRLNGPYY